MEDAPGTGSGEPVKIRVQRDSTALDFWCFDTPTSRIVTNLILKGRTYPQVDLVEDAEVVLDIGANVGASSVYFAETYPSATVYAFEPAARPFELLVRNTSDHPRVRAHDFGLHNTHRNVELFAGRHDSVTASVGKSHLNRASGEIVELWPADQWLAAHEIHRIDVLKVDTEGCELAILGALREVLPRTTVIHLEYHSEDDRLELDQMLKATHILAKGEIHHLHRGELTYVAKAAFGESPALRRDQISADI